MLLHVMKSDRSCMEASDCYSTHLAESYNHIGVHVSKYGNDDHNNDTEDDSDGNNVMMM